MKNASDTLLLASSHAATDADPLAPLGSVCATRLEEFASRVREVLLESEVTRTRDCVQIDWGGEQGIVVLITSEAMELRLPTVEWAGGHCPRSTSKLWRRVDWNDLSDTELRTLFSAAKTARRRQFRTCQFCGQRVPSEHRIDQNTCHGCATKEYGVVY